MVRRNRRARAFDDFHLAKSYFDKRNYEAAFYWYQEAAKGGRAEAFRRLGDFYCDPDSTGHIAVRDLQNARAFYERASG